MSTFALEKPKGSSSEGRMPHSCARSAIGFNVAAVCAISISVGTGERICSFDAEYTRRMGEDLLVFAGEFIQN